MCTQLFCCLFLELQIRVNKEPRLGHIYTGTCHLWLQPGVPIDQLPHSCVPSFLRVEERWEEEKEDRTNLNLEWKCKWGFWIPLEFLFPLHCLCRFLAPVGRRGTRLRGVCAPREVWSSTCVSLQLSWENAFCCCVVSLEPRPWFVIVHVPVWCKGLKSSKDSRVHPGTLLVDRLESGAWWLIFRILPIWLFFSISWTLPVLFKTLSLDNYW